jgi:hypothetical protein
MVPRIAFRRCPPPRIGAGLQHLAVYIPPLPPPPPSPPPCSGAFRSWCSGEEGQSGALAWPVVLSAQPASAKTRKSAASRLCQCISFLSGARSGEPINHKQQAEATGAPRRKLKFECLPASATPKAGFEVEKPWPQGLVRGSQKDQPTCVMRRCSRDGVRHLMRRVAVAKWKPPCSKT